jgi:transposase InsO family protein
MNEKELAAEERQHSSSTSSVGNEGDPEGVLRQILKDQASSAHLYGHVGPQAMMEWLKDGGYNCSDSILRKICKGIADSCVVCARNTMKRQGYHPLSSIHATLPFDHVSIDLCKMEMSGKGNNYVLVVKDVLTKFVVLRPLMSKTMEEVARQLYDIFTLLGFPKIIQSDNGREFKNQLMAAWQAMGLFQHRLSTPYNPRSNGCVERANSDIIRMLKAMCRGKTTAWCTMLPMVQYYKNVAVSRSHKSSPFALMFTRRFNPFEMSWNETEPLSSDQLAVATKDRLEVLREATEVIYPEAAKSLREYQAKQEEQVRRHNKLIERLPPNTTVMVVNRSKHKKLDDNFIGPFTVIRSDRAGAYQLLDSTGELFSRKVAPADLRIISLPEPNELAYVVEKVMDEKIKNGLQMYLVKWRGYDDSYNTWEPVSSFVEFDCISEFHRNKL